MWFFFFKINEMKRRRKKLKGKTNKKSTPSTQIFFLDKIFMFYIIANVFWWMVKHANFLARWREILYEMQSMSMYTELFVPF